jgi:2-aminobenzoate-CoA ligase
MASTQPDVRSEQVHLPPRDLWPERVYTREEFRSYPEVFNAAEMLLGQQLAAGRGDHPAVLYQDEVITYAEPVDRVDRLGAVLAGLGVGEGDRVLIRSLNEPPALVANFATLKLGVVVVPTSPLLGPDQLAHIANDCEPVVLVVGGWLLPAALAARPLIPSLRHVVVYGADPEAVRGSGCLVYEELVAAADPRLTPLRQSRSAVSVLLYSSGLLEPARATAHFQDELLIIPDGFGRYGWQITPDDVVAGAGPISFAGGYSTILALPTRHREMLAVDGADPADLASLRMVSGGGEPLAADTVTGGRDCFGLEVYEGFGTNGMMHVFITTAVGRVIKPGSMGTAVPGYRTRVPGPDGEEAAPGEPGQLYVQGPVGPLWWGRPDAAADVAERQAATVRDGWVRVGDWIVRDPDGHLFFVAREEDLITRCGERFCPVEIERALEAHPAVGEVGVHATAGAGGQRVIALVVPAPEVATTDELAAPILADCGSRLPASRVPDEIIFLDGLPRSLFGTLLRRAQWPGWPAQRAQTPSPRRPSPRRHSPRGAPPRSRRPDPDRRGRGDTRPTLPGPSGWAIPYPRTDQGGTRCSLARVRWPR